MGTGNGNRQQGIERMVTAENAKKKKKKVN